MLIKMLSRADRLHFLDLASLLTISDKPLIWDGETYEELTRHATLAQLSLEVGETERELIEELGELAGLSGKEKSSNISDGGALSRASDRLIRTLKGVPTVKMEDPSTRAWAGTSVLLKLLAEKSYDLPSTPKVILYELFLVALRDGHISGIEWILLKEVQKYYKLEDYIFDDLLERAETLNQEVTKTIAIILE